jgi:hypothetical protein
MWTWVVVGGYEVFAVVLVSCIARTALSPDSTPKRRETAYKMFRIIWPTTVGGLAAALVKLHANGLL